MRLPAWQFADGRVLTGLAEVIAAWPGTKLSLAVWARAPCPDLGGLTPADALAAGRVRAVLASVRAVSPAAW